MEETGYAAPTMVTDGRRVIALFATGDLVACDFDGQRLWARNLGVPDNHYGHASSLIQRGELVYVQYDQLDQARLIAIRARDGSTAWQQVRETDASWASPILIEHEGVASVVLSAAPLVAAYDPESGVPRWSLDCVRGEIAPSPAFGAGRVFAANDYPRLAAIDAAAGTQLWEYEDDLPDVPSPLATDRRVYISSSYGVLTCLAIETGDLLWQHELDVDVYSSPVAAAGRIHVLDRDGGMHIFRDADAYESAGAGAIHEPSTCTAAIVDGRIYIRGFTHLFCIEDAGGDGAP
jgi:outer membrane protein assembly factor BamB